MKYINFLASGRCRIGGTRMIESIDRALAVLQLFLKEERPLSVTRISKLMDLHKSTVSRTMDTLERRGFVQKDSETGK